MTSPNLTTTTTCNEQCWYAKEPECSCSCGGANHGCLRVEGAEQPTRNSRIKDKRYLLRAVGLFAEISSKRYEIARREYARHRRELAGGGQPVIVKRASKDQIERWPELTAYRDHVPERHSASPRSRRGAPYLLWVREDVEA